MEGGGPTLTCIAWYQNGLGGAYLQNFYRDLSLEQNDPFIIRMDTCDFPAEPVSYPAGQEPASLALKRDLSSLDWLPVPSRGIGGYTIRPISNSSGGPHNAIVDGGGTAYWTAEANGTSTKFTVSYDMDEDVADAFLAIAAASSISISADFTATQPPLEEMSSTTTSSAPTATSSAAGGHMATHRFFEKALLAFLVVDVARVL
ncbi:hypothetical protein LTS10_002815 [Elasticomyces elasticus]|nr:hypothetical protein LTS10_002815 [Elasticomyces elasticus]